MPSGFEPIFPWGSENVDVGSANTKSKSGSMATAMPDVDPFSPHTSVFGNAASDIKKFLEKIYDVEMI